MSWDIVLFNSREKIESIEHLDENQLEAIDFAEILERSFPVIIKTENHRAIKGTDFSIEFFTDAELVSNTLLSLSGENGLFELIELSKHHGWQIFDTALGSMIDLENPETNGFENHRNYVAQVMKNLNQ